MAIKLNGAKWQHMEHLFGAQTMFFIYFGGSEKAEKVSILPCSCSLQAISHCLIHFSKLPEKIFSGQFNIELYIFLFGTIKC